MQRITIDAPRPKNRRPATVPAAPRPTDDLAPSSFAHLAATPSCVGARGELGRRRKLRSPVA